MWKKERGLPPEGHSIFKTDRRGLTGSGWPELSPQLSGISPVGCG